MYLVTLKKKLYIYIYLLLTKKGKYQNKYKYSNRFVQIQKQIVATHCLEAPSMFEQLGGTFIFLNFEGIVSKGGTIQCVV